MTPSESPSPAGNGQVAASESPVQQVQGRDIMGRFQGNAPGAPSGNTEDTKPVTGEVLVDWGGVERRVKVEELVATARNVEQLKAQAEALAEAARRQVVTSEAHKGLLERAAQLNPQQRAALAQFLENPDQFRPVTTPPPAEEDPFLAPPAQPKPAIPPELQQRLDEMERGMETVASFLTKIGTERQAQTLADNVDQLMAQLPVFQAARPALVEMARNAILTQLARDPRQQLEPLVHAVAVRTQEVHQGYQPPGLASPRPSGQDEKPRYSGADLLSGKVREDARAMLRQAYR